MKLTARRPAGLAPVMLAVACAALLIAQHVAARAVRDALFLSTFGAGVLPQAMLAAAVVGLVAVVAASWLMARWGPGRAIPALLLVSSLVHVVEWHLLGERPTVAVVLAYLHISIAGGIAVSGLWSVVNERFDPYTVRRIATRLSAGLAAGGLLGGLVTRGIGPTYGLGAMLLVFAVGSALAGVLLRALSAGSSALEVTAVRPVSGQGGSSAGYLASMATLVALMGLSSAVVDFVFKAQVSSELRSGESLVAFFALFYMVVSVVSVVLQLTLARPMLARFGLGMGLASLPAAVVGLGVLGLLVPGAWVSVLLRGSGVVLESSLFRAAYEPLYAPLPVWQKRSKKTLIDVAGDRVGEALGSGFVLVLAAFAPLLATRFGLALAVLASMGAVVLALRLERGYVAELASSLRSGRVRLDDEEIGDATTRLTLSQTQLELDREGLIRQIEELRRAPPVERSRPERELVALLATGDAERINAALRAGPLDVDLASLVLPCLGRDETAEAAVVALRSVAQRVPGLLVDVLLDPARPLRLRRRIPRVLRTCPHPRAARGLAEALTDPEADLRQRAALALRDLARKNPELLPPRRVVLEAAAHELELAGEGTFDQVFMLLGLLLDTEALELALRALASDDEKLRGTALEYLENVIPEPIRGGIWPYLQAGRRPRQAQARKPADIAEELRRSFG
jgi:AAA family ATP:ADP antiporter